MNSIEPLRMFRDRFYAGLGRRADALFELCDAILTAGRVPSPPRLSFVSVHRRGWGSLYAALSKGRIDWEALRELLAAYDLAAMGTPVYAVDVSPWPRCDAEALTHYLGDVGGLVPDLSEDCGCTATGLVQASTQWTSSFDRSAEIPINMPIYRTQ